MVIKAVMCCLGHRVPTNMGIDHELDGTLHTLKHLVGPRPLDGRGVLLTLWGWGGVGHVLTFM